MKRLINILYGDKEPQPQNALWLKRVGIYECAPYINDNGRWIPIKIGESSSFLRSIVLYKSSDTEISDVVALMASRPSTSNKKEMPANIDKPYFYIALPGGCTLEKVITEYGEDILPEFILKSVQTITINNTSVLYNMYDFHVEGTLIPLNAHVVITINNDAKNS